MNQLANGNFGGGDGSELNPFIVEDKEDFIQVFHKNMENQEYHFKQVNDIDLFGIDWIPIGDVAKGPPFMGIFDGGDKFIDNLKVSSSSNYIGLFGLCVGATLRNINITKAEVVSLNGFYASILTSYLDGSCVVSNCSVQGTVIGNYSRSNIAGLVVSASSSSVIERCSVNAKLIGHHVAGAVLYSKGIIEDCYVVGAIEGISINSESRLQTSTFAHSCDSTCVIKNCYSVVTISNANTDNTYMGLFASPSSPYELPTIQSCYSDISVGVAIDGWVADVSYYSGGQPYYLRGTDNELYKLLKNQDPVDYSGLPPYTTFYEARPISGSRYSEFWGAVTPDTDENARTTQQMKTKANYIGWDFDKVWTIDEGKSYPTFKKKRAIITCKRVPLTNYRR